MRAQLMSRLRDERGMTLVELLVTASIGMLVLTAIGYMITASERSTQRVRAQVDATQRARVALDQATQPLRSMVCVSVAPSTTTGTATLLMPIVAAAPDSITYYADLDNDTVADAEQRRLSVLRDAGGRPTALVEDRWVGIAVPVPTGSESSYRRRLVAARPQSAEATAGAQTPFLRYFAFPDNAAAETVELSPGATVAAADLPHIARIDVGFRTAPVEGRAAPADSVDITTSVYARAVSRDTGADRPSYDCEA